ncbi:MAG: hypothetical protein KGL39_50935 [Patescibacteria group bacterium]|nr:hypothetical protein [Patescibacteria group bacterium]
MTRVTAGPYSLDLRPNSRATLYVADGAGEDHEVPWGRDCLDALVQFAGEVVRLKAYADSAIAGERERCAKLAESFGHIGYSGLAAAIREGSA